MLLVEQGFTRMITLHMDTLEDARDANIYKFHSCLVVNGEITLRSACEGCTRR